MSMALVVLTRVKLIIFHIVTLFPTLNSVLLTGSGRSTHDGFDPADDSAHLLQTNA